MELYNGIDGLSSIDVLMVVGTIALQIASSHPSPKDCSEEARLELIIISGAHLVSPHHMSHWFHPRYLHNNILLH